MSGEPVFDKTATPFACAGCGQQVVRVRFAADPEPACPICRGRESAALALEEGAVPAGPWPRLVLRRGAPLAGGALSCGVPGSEALLEVPEGALARLRRDGDRLLLSTLAAGVHPSVGSGIDVDGVEIASGEERELRVGARVRVGGRELIRA